ncbi:MAG: LPS-assembly protein LptD [Alphaproteobacteria bacterium]
MIKRLTNSKDRHQHVAKAACYMLSYSILAISLSFAPKAYSLEQNIEFSSQKSNNPTHFSAREVTYNTKTNIVEARGRVTAIRDNQTVKADIFRYDTQKDRMYALGNIEAINSDGTIIHTDKFELSGDFKDAVSSKLIARLPDGSLIAAKRSKRVKGRYNQFYDAAYTPCSQCLETKGKKPLWMIRSKKVIHDQQNKYITARNVTFDVYGQPVLWFPWFGYPDPTVKRKTGLLTPSFGYDERLGIYGSLPLFIVVNDYADLTLNPYIYSKDNPRLASRYRQRFSGGGFDINFSGTMDRYADRDYKPQQEVDDFRWDIDSHFWWQLAPKWFLTSNVRLASDKYYLEDYDIDTEVDKAGFLQSNITLERRGYDSWFQAQSIYFQTEDTGINQKYVPTILPEVSFDWQSSKDYFGGNSYLSLQSRSLYRETSVDSSKTPRNLSVDTPRQSQRFMAKAGWAGHWFGMLGEEYSFDTSLTALHWLNKDYYVHGEDLSQGVSQIRPNIQMGLSYPVVRYSPYSTITLEPVVQAIWSPEYDAKDYKFVPNEDSQDFELTGNNLFTSNRFSGFDRDEGGLRINYGLRGSIDLAQAGYSRFQVGQVWRPNYNGQFDADENSGLDSEFSDIVTQLEIYPVNWFSLSSNGRFDQKDFSIRRLDFGGAVGPQSLKVSGYYTWFDDLENNKVTEELRLGLSTRISEQFRLNGYVVQDLQQTTDSRPKEARASFYWENECIALGAFYKREWKSGGDEENTFGVQFSLKTLGDLNLSL